MSTTTKTLFAISIIWFVVVLAWSLYRGEFFLGLGHGKVAKIVAYAFVYFFPVLIFGWIAPLALGLYRLAKHR